MKQLVKFEIENTVDPLTGNYNRSDLKRVDSDIANILKGAKSSISKNDFISTRNKVIDESTGKMITEIITEAKNALNVSSAINSKISEISIRAGRNNGGIVLKANGSMEGGTGGETWSITQSGTATFNKIIASSSGTIGG